MTYKLYLVPQVKTLENNQPFLVHTCYKMIEAQVWIKMGAILVVEGDNEI